MAISHFFLDKLFHPILQIPAIVETCNLDNYPRSMETRWLLPNIHLSPSLRRNHSSVDSQQPFKLSIHRFTLKTAGLSTTSSWETIGKSHIASVMPSTAGLLMGEVARKSGSCYIVRKSKTKQQLKHRNSLSHSICSLSCSCGLDMCIFQYTCIFTCITC